MITQTIIYTRPDASIPWFNDAPEMQAYLAPRDVIKDAHPELTGDVVRTTSEDGLTMTAVQRFPSLAAYNQYIALLKQAIPDWPAGRNQYAKDHNQSMAITVVDTYDH
jgi:hypothetical protein